MEFLPVSLLTCEEPYVGAFYEIVINLCTNQYCLQ
jgi:hypothetical protein